MAKDNKKTFWEITGDGKQKISEKEYDLVVDTLASNATSVAIVRSEDKTSIAITAPIGVMKKEDAETFVEGIMPEIETIAAKLETSDKEEIEKNFSTDSEGNNLVTIFIPAEADMDEVEKILSESIGFKPKKKSKDDKKSKDGDSKKKSKDDDDDSSDKKKSKDGKKKPSKKSKNDDDDSSDKKKSKDGKKKSKDDDDDSGDKKSKKELNTVEKFDKLCGSDAEAAKKIAENSLYKAARARGSFGSTMTAVINRTYDEVLG